MRICGTSTSTVRSSGDPRFSDVNPVFGGCPPGISLRVEHKSAKIAILGVSLSFYVLFGALLNSLERLLEVNKKQFVESEAGDSDCNDSFVDLLFMSDGHVSI